MSVALSHPYKNNTLLNALQDLAVRFLLNIPQEDLTSSERLFFQLEEAQWFYEDFVRVENPSLPSMKLKTFAERLFEACPILKTYSQDVQGDLAKFQSYKSVIPVRGSIILNKKMTKALMVKGWKQGASWGFPRGKINKDEEDSLCAVREVYEEIGFDISPYLKPEDYIETTIRQKNFRLYIVRGVPGSTVFNPQTRKEISKIQWHDVADLPAFSRNQLASNKGKWDYFMVAPFMAGLRQYIKKAKGEAASLSKDESVALKNLLGVGKTALTEDATHIQDNDAAATELLSLIKGKHNEPDQKNILLDLLNKNAGPSEQPKSDIESAKEILSLLRNEINDFTQLQQMPAQPLPPMPPMYPMFGLPPPPPFGFAGLPPPPPVPPQFMQSFPIGVQPPQGWIPPPLPPPQIAAPIPHHPMPPPPHVSPPSQNVTTALEDRDRLVRYNAPPPPPPNPILVSLLNKKKKNINDAKDSEDKSRFESFHSASKQKSSLSEILGESKSSSNGLLSLLGNSQPRTPVQQQATLATARSPSASLMDLLRPQSSQPQETAQPESQAQAKNEGDDLMALLNGSQKSQPQPQSQSLNQDSNNLMALLNPKSQSHTSQQTESENLMQMLRPSSKASDTVAQTGIPESSNESQSLMGLLNSSAQYTPEATTPSQPDLMSLLKPQKPASRSSSSQDKPKSPSQNLMDLLGNSKSPEQQQSPSKELMGMLKSSKSPKSPQSPSSDLLGMLKPKDRVSSPPSSSTALMDLLNPQQPKKNKEIVESSKPDTRSSSGASLMNLLNINSDTRSSPSPSVDLMGLLNSQPSKASDQQEAKQPAKSKPSKRGNDLMNLLSPSPSLADENTQVSAVDESSVAAPVPAANKAQDELKPEEKTTKPLDPLDQFLQAYTSGKI